MRALNSRQAEASWTTPLHDGGKTLSALQIQVDTTQHFNSSGFASVVLPVVHEVQVLAVQLEDVHIEKQTIEIVEDVTNEIQTFTTVINGVDEV